MRFEVVDAQLMTIATGHRTHAFITRVGETVLWRQKCKEVGIGKCDVEYRESVL